MRILGLISGGKDSFYNLMHCVANGHKVIALGNLHPPSQEIKDEMDSYMYQTVGHDVIHLYKDCLEVPLYRQEIKGRPIEQGSDYVVTSMDETEDLFQLLQKVKTAHPDLEAVSVGAILSTYQRIRVENVCARLGLVTLAYLWQRDQEELLSEMAQAGVNAILIKVAAIGLKTQHLGQSIGDMYPYLCRMNQQYDLHICGEGGEYETVTLDCPLFKRRIVVDESEIVIHSDDHFAQVAYLRFKKLHLEDKSDEELDLNWKTDMNLNPVWRADSMIVPIGGIVCSKLQLKDDSGESESVGSTIPGVTYVSKHDCTRVGHHSKFSTHQGNIICAVGMTNAFEGTSIETRRHLSIAEETTACLQNVQAKLDKIGLSWAEVVFMQVFVSDMGDFGVVNGAYKEFFDINPPPRACVGANLPNEIRIQVSCNAIRKSASSPKPRKTLHVQGISYWAPANIGPYSQATQQAYHAYIAGQIGMIPCTLDLPEPPSLAKETAWSLRNLAQIAAVCQMDINNPAPILAICMPSLPKGAQVEWQATLHNGKVYADKTIVQTTATGDQDGYETDDDDMYQLEKRALHPTTLSLVHEHPLTPESSAVFEQQWEAKRDDKHVIAEDVLIDMLAMMVNAMDRVLDSHIAPAVGPGVEGGWSSVVGVTLYYYELLIREPDSLASKLEALLSKLGTSKSDTVPSSDSSKDITSQSTVNNIAVTLVPVQAIANSGVLALTLHAVGTMPTIPGLLQA
ncbi:hypothetical protein BGX27_006081 [Mortierella sp. AM989]|nr:hypothetical protein BGX27_006081 [Mortierella sp. AM989]